MLMLRHCKVVINYKENWTNKISALSQVINTDTKLATATLKEINASENRKHYSAVGRRTPMNKVCLHT